MPYEIRLEKPPMGYAVTAARASEHVQVAIREFTSTEDGQHFIQRLEGSPSIILQSLPTEIRPSNVDNMLAIFDRDGKVTVYVNELELRASFRAARPVKAGAAVLKDQCCRHRVARSWRASTRRCRFLVRFFHRLAQRTLLRLWTHRAKSGTTPI